MVKHQDAGFHASRARRVLWIPPESAFLVALLSGSLAGCAAFPGKVLPERRPERVSTAKFPVDFEVEWYTVERRNNFAARSFSNEVRTVLNESGMFSEVAYGKGQAPLHLHFRMNNEGNMFLGKLLGVISGLTLTVLPAYARDDYILTVDVKKDERLLKSYEYKDHMTTWIQLFLIFAMHGRKPEDIGDQLRSNMVVSFRSGCVDSPQSRRRGAGSRRSTAPGDGDSVPLEAAASAEILKTAASRSSAPLSWPRAVRGVGRFRESRLR